MSMQAALPLASPVRGKVARAPSPRCHPLVRQLLDEVDRRRLHAGCVSELAGVNHCMISGWRREHVPNLANFEAVANLLGFDVVLVPREP